ncbi:MAG: hypothetical protein JWM35_305 [Verrucomicrobia bacterium]|nr:hypothetical protein [Verrucomicrobiota bacterium]
MPALPPLLSAETLDRVVRHARINGMWVLVGSTTLALLSAAGGEVPKVAVWLLAAGTGAMALHGGALLNQGYSRGINWLVSAQLFCLAFILAYCGWQLRHADLAPLREAMTAEMRASVKQTGLTDEEFLLLSYRLTYALFAFIATLYLGCMTLYYQRRRSVVIAALTEE